MLRAKIKEQKLNDQINKYFYLNFLNVNLQIFSEPHSPLCEQAWARNTRELLVGDKISFKIDIDNDIRTIEVVLAGDMVNGCVGWNALVIISEYPKCLGLHEGKEIRALLLTVFLPKVNLDLNSVISSIGNAYDIWVWLCACLVALLCLSVSVFLMKEFCSAFTEQHRKYYLEKEWQVLHRNLQQIYVHNEPLLTSNDTE